MEKGGSALKEQLFLFRTRPKLSGGVLLGVLALPCGAKGHVQKCSTFLGLRAYNLGAYKGLLGSFMMISSGLQSFLTRRYRLSEAICRAFHRVDEAGLMCLLCYFSSATLELSDCLACLSSVGLQIGSIGIE